MLPSLPAPDPCLLYDDPTLYDALFPAAAKAATCPDPTRRDRILASERFYLAETDGRGPALELACGSGRLTVPLAVAGIDVTGADLSAAMLDAARSKALQAGVKIPFHHADMRDFHLGRRFSTILIPGNSLLHLLAFDEWEQCLTAVHRHLAPGGRLLFDISHWQPAMLTPEPGTHTPALRITGVSGDEILIEETATYDAASQIRHIRWHFSTPAQPDFRVAEYRLRVVFPQELPLLLRIGGFRLEARFGEFTREPFQPTSPRQVCICVPA